MDLLSLKIIVLSISGAIRLFFGLIPLILMKSFTKRLSSKKIKYVISILMFFGGGVLLATCLLHMMPGVRESFASVNLKTELPVPELIFVGGFFLVYLLEDIVHGVIHRRRQNKEQKKLRIKSPTGTDMPQHISPKRSPNSSYKAEIPNDYGYGNPNKVSYTTNGFWPNEPQDIHHTPSIIPRARSGSDTGNGNHKQIVDPEWWRDTVVSTNNSQLSLITGSIPSINSTKPHAHSDESDDEHNHHIPFDESDPSVAGAIRNLLIVIAISFHAVFEGLAIGLQGTEKDVWALFIAVSLHECTIIFCIGVELISAKTKVLRMLTYILVVSLVSPLGIGIGILISEQSTGSTMLHVLLVGSLQGVAAGTLLYVTFFEIFAAEGRKIENKVIHIIVAILGFILMTSIDMMGGHSHGHGNENFKSTSINSTQVEHDHGHHSHSHGHSGEHESGELHEHDHDHSH